MSSLFGTNVRGREKIMRRCPSAYDTQAEISSDLLFFGEA
jgi:hypothetical protein